MTTGSRIKGNTLISVAEIRKRFKTKAKIQEFFLMMGKLNKFYHLGYWFPSAPHRDWETFLHVSAGKKKVSPISISAFEKFRRSRHETQAFQKAKFIDERSSEKYPLQQSRAT